MRVCTLASSSSGNCTLVTDGETSILIDAGISMRRIADGLRRCGAEPDKLSAILVTHEHSDHISGLRMMTKYFKTPVFTTAGTARGICCAFPETEQYIHTFRAGEGFELGTAGIESFPTPHDTPESVGFRVTAGGRVFVLATDMGFLSESVLSSTLGAYAAVIEANHDVDMLRNGSYPYYLKQRILSDRGHMSNLVCGCFAQKLAESGTRRIILGHLSRENNTPELARKTVCCALRKLGAEPGRDVELSVAPRDTPGGAFIL